MSRPDYKLDFGFTRRLPVVLQTEAAECGLACLTMIGCFYGFKTDLNSLRHMFPISAQGAALKQVIRIASDIKMQSRAIRLELDDIKELLVPCILHWEMEHFVVLKKVVRKGIWIHDPAIGERFYSMKEVDNLFTGVALELSPSQDFATGDNTKPLTLSHFWTTIVGLKRSLTVVLLLSLCLQLFAIISPYFIQIVVDDVILRADITLLNILAAGFFLLLLVELATHYLRQFVILHLSSKLNVQMATNVFHHLIRLPLDYFSKRHMGDLVSRFGSLNVIRELLTTGVVTVLVDGVMAILTLVVMLWYDVKLTLIVLAVVVLYGLLRFLLYRPLRILNEEQIVASAKENSHFMESLRAIQSIKLFEKEPDRQIQWQNRLTDSLNKNIRITRWNIGFDTANRFLFGTENIAIIYFAAIAVTQNLLSVGMLYAFISYKSRFISSMDQLIAKWIEFKMLDLHFDRLADIVFSNKDQLLALETTHKRPVQNTISVIEGNIAVNDLSFTFSGSETALFSHLNMSIKAGETVAIVGPSGSGKSTLLKCIMGLYQPQSGQILIDGKSVQSWHNYRHQIAAVMQEDQLLSGSIADNIACFDNQVDMQLVIQCAIATCIHEEILNASMQYNTLVGDMGTHLSGGQKQRILLARALYKRPRILFMDEATSHLDTPNEQQINEHIKSLSITRVIIAHRPETIAMADRALLLVNGRLEVITNAVKLNSPNKDI